MLTKSLVSNLNSFARSLTNAIVREALRPVGLNLAEYQILFILNSGAKTTDEIKRALHMDKAILSRNLMKLKDMKAVLISYDEFPNRSMILPTVTGSRMLKRVDKQVKKLENEWFGKNQVDMQIAFNSDYVVKCTGFSLSKK